MPEGEGGSARGAYKAVTEANDSLLAERESWAAQGRLYEQSMTEVARISDRVAELEGQVASSSEDETRLREVVEARNRRLNSDNDALK